MIVFRRWMVLIGICSLTACGGGSSQGGTTPSNDAGTEQDTASTDASEDTTAPVDTASEFSGLAWTYEHNPTDTPELSKVMLAHLTTEDHTLAGEFARVRNCTQDLEKGQSIPINTGGIALDITLCHPTHTALPGDDGTYLHITPPDQAGGDDDTFAEVMMYHHMQVIHDYFKTVHGFTDLDFPLDAVVNLQGHIGLCNEWASIGNAAFFPDGAMDQFGVELDLGIDGPAIIFGQTGQKDFSYDATVIYHEYTHAMVGSTRLNAAFVDNQGLNNLPGALNEAYADYFAGTITNNSVVGSYALNAMGPQTICGFELGGGNANMARDMATFHQCPDDLTAEVHADGEIFSSALWAIRVSIGKAKADAVILNALMTFTHTTDFTLAAGLTISRAENMLDSGDAALVKQAFEERGLINCKRVVPSGKVGATGLPVRFEGSGALNPNPFGGYMPGYVQVGVELPEGVTEVTVTVNESGGGGAFGGGGSLLTGDLAWKQGSGPVIYTFGFGGGSVTHDAVVLTPLTDQQGKSTARLAGKCLKPGLWTFSVHNKGDGASVSGITVKTSTLPVEDPNFDDCN